MDNTVSVALISSSGSVLVAITALILNYRLRERYPSRGLL
jgi:hypothetical protein